MIDYCEVRGQIKCQVNLAENPQITMQVEGLTQEILDNFRLNVPGKIFRTENIHNDGLQISFYPQIKPFDLCLYQSFSNFNVPIQAQYQSKEISPNEVKFLLSLKFEQYIIKHVAECKIIISFKKYHVIAKTDLDVQVGKVRCWNNNENLQWIMTGWQLNPSQTMYVLTGTVYLNPQFHKTDQDQQNYHDQHLQTNNYALLENFVQISFQIQECLFTSLTVNPEMINIYPFKKPRIKIIKRSYAKNYYAYNILNNNFTPFTMNFGDQKLIQKLSQGRNLVQILDQNVNDFIESP